MHDITYTLRIFNVERYVGWGRGGGSTLALVRQNIAEVLYLYAGQENGLEWWNGPWNGLWIYICHSNTV